MMINKIIPSVDQSIGYWLKNLDTHLNLTHFNEYENACFFKNPLNFYCEFLRLLITHTYIASAVSYVNLCINNIRITVIFSP